MGCKGSFPCLQIPITWPPCSENELHCLYKQLTSVILVLPYAVTLCTMPQFMQSKVSDLQHPTTCNYTVRWLQIAMESQYGAMNVQHSLPNSITTYIAKFQNNKQETHTIIVQWTCQLRLWWSDAMSSLYNIPKGVLYTYFPAHKTHRDFFVRNFRKK